MLALVEQTSWSNGLVPVELHDRDLCVSDLKKPYLLQLLSDFGELRDIKVGNVDCLLAFSHLWKLDRDRVMIEVETGV